MFDSAVRLQDDERALGLLRLSRAGRPAEDVARDLLRLSQSMSEDAMIAAEAVHIAAEASTDGSFEDAALTFSANEVTRQEFSARRSSDAQWHQFKVLAGSS
jgi:hypothetical protein